MTFSSLSAFAARSSASSCSSSAFGLIRDPGAFADEPLCLPEKLVVVAHEAIVAPAHVSLAEATKLKLGELVVLSHPAEVIFPTVNLQLGADHPGAGKPPRIIHRLRPLLLDRWWRGGWCPCPLRPPIQHRL